MMEAVTHIVCDSVALVPNREEDKAGCSGDWQDGNKRRSEDNHSWNSSANQKGKQDENWRSQDRGTGAGNYSRSAGDGGKKLFLPPALTCKNSFSCTL